MLNETDRQRIAEAVGEAEAKTSGEIFCVLTHEVSNYREVPLAWGVVAALLVPPLVVLTGLDTLARADIFTSWSDESLRAVSYLILRALSAYALLQTGLFAAVTLVISLPRVRRTMTPVFLKRHRVRQVARHHFVATGYRLAADAPHVLIYASLLDRQVEIVAHKAIHEIVGAQPWKEMADAVVAGMKSGKPADGFVRAIGICGDVLARHFPSSGPAKNQIPNAIVET